MKFCTIIFLCVFLVSSCAFAENHSPRDEQKTSPECSTAAATSKMAPLLQNVKAFNLHVTITPRDYEEALKCEGKEEQCAQGRGDERAKKWYIEKLKNTNKNYPKVLTVENVTRLFSKEIEQDLGSLMRDGCSELSVINDAPWEHCIDGNVAGSFCARKTILEYINDPANLTFSVTIRIANDLTNADPSNQGRHPYAGLEDGPDPRIAVLTWMPVRKNCVPAYMASHSSIQAIIPFNLGQEEIEKYVNSVVKSASLYMHWFQSGDDNYSFTCTSSTADTPSK